MRRRGLSVSGCVSIRRSKVCLFQVTKLGGLFLFNLTEFFGVVARFGHKLGILDLVLGCLGDHHALGVEARAAGATGNLMELAGAQATHLVAIELGERGEHHGVDGYVDADAERIGAAETGSRPCCAKRSTSRR